MPPLQSHEIIAFFLGAAVLLGAARLLGELALKLNQPAILGEIFGGILLGPAVLGYLSPEFSEWLLPENGAWTVLEGFNVLSASLLLFVAGLEIELSHVRHQVRGSLWVSVLGFLIPFISGAAAGWFLPPQLFGFEGDSYHLTLFALFFGTAFTICGLPVVARTLMDLNLLKNKIGTTIMTSAMLLDLSGWVVFSVLLGLAGATTFSAGSAVRIVVQTVCFTVLVLTIGRWLIDRVLNSVRKHLTWPGGVLGLVLMLSLVSAAATEAIGIHSIFGAFLAGIAIGDSKFMDGQARDIIRQFVLNFFAPIYFASIGLRVNFAAHFDLQLIALVVVLCSVSRIFATTLGAHLGGMPQREAWAVGFGMNAGGVMQIIFGTLAFQHGFIGENLLVAFIVLALVTSALSGPMMSVLLGRREPVLVLKPAPAWGVTKEDVR
ncbi:cation:proton antiporter [Candidatus Nitrospira bockiana]